MFSLVSPRQTIGTQNWQYYCYGHTICYSICIQYGRRWRGGAVSRCGQWKIMPSARRRFDERTDKEFVWRTVISERRHEAVWPTAAENVSVRPRETHTGPKGRDENTVRTGALLKRRRFHDAFRLGVVLWPTRIVSSPFRSLDGVTSSFSFSCTRGSHQSVR